MTEGPFASGHLQAAWKALEDFPVAAEKVVPVSVSENLTFRVTARNHETDYVLRLHRPEYNSIGELDSERVWTRALNESGIAVPDALQTHRGENYTLVEIPGLGERRYAGVTTWIEGTVLGEKLETDFDPAQRREAFCRIGAMLAEIHNQSAGWRQPPGFSRRRLDADGLLGDLPAWGRFWEHPALSAAERALLLERKRKLRAALAEYGESPDRFSLIHADAHPSNIIHNGGELALIDFDDVAYGWHMYDLAVTLDECMHASDLGALQSALVEGYLARRPLRKRDIEMLPLFLLIRGLALIGWYYERPEHEGSRYFEELKAWVLGECGQEEPES